MKRFLHILTTLISGLFLTVQLSAQCTPDPGCLDTLQAGEYSPQDFPPLQLNVAYDEVITFILALEIEYNGTPYTLDSIAVDSVRNLPPGLTYNSSAIGYVPQSSFAGETSLA